MAETREVVKIATGITARKLSAAENASKLDALSRGQAMFEFTAIGDILTANESFLKALGYSLAELHGRHHPMLFEPCFSPPTAMGNLASGALGAEEFMRIGKVGRKAYNQQ